MYFIHVINVNSPKTLHTKFILKIYTTYKIDISMIF